MKTIYRILTIIFMWALVLQTTTSNAQCLSAINGQWPSSTFTPASCTGVEATVTACGFRSEYSVVNVVAGNLYTFRSSIATDFITVSDGTGTTAFTSGVSGASGITWVSTITGTIRYYTHTSSACGAESVTCMTRFLTCAPAPCLTAINGQWPSSTFAPTCNGTLQTVTACGFRSEYSVVTVISGNSYNFRSSIPTDIITISNAAGTTSFLSAVGGAGGLTWTATLSGNVRFYTHLAGCGAESVTCMTRSMSCSAPSVSCLTAVNGQWPSSTYTPLCTNAFEIVTSCGFRSEYSMVNVVSGTSYTFLSSVASDIITIANSAGTTAFTGGVGGATGLIWVATVTGPVRFYTHLAGCAAESVTCMTRSMKCAGAVAANDLICSATTITCGQTLTGTTVGSTTTGETGLSYCTTTYDNAGGVWYTIVPVPGQIVTASLCGSSYDSKIHIFSSSTGTCSGILSCVAGNDDFCGAQSSVDFTATAVPSNRYYILVHGWNGNVGAFTLNISCLSPPPANDDCAGAITMTAGSTCSNTPGSTVFSTQSQAPSLCSSFTSTTANDVWYKFTATGANNYTVSMTGSGGMDGIIQLFSGACGSLVSLGCSDLTTGNGTESFNGGVLAAGTYYYRVYSWGNTSGLFTTCVTFTGPPLNDQCSFVTPVTLTSGTPVTFTGTTLGATLTNDGAFPLASVWHAVTLTGVCNNLTLNYCGTTPVHPFAWQQLATSCPATTITAAGVFTNCGDGNNFITYNGLPAGTYYIPVLGDYPGPPVNPAGPYTLQVTSIDCPLVTNDFICSATNISCNSTTAGTTLNATTTNETTLPFCTTIGGSAPGVWYRLSTTIGQIVTIDLCNGGTAYDSKLHVYSSSNNLCSGTLTCVAGNDDACGLQSSLSFTATGTVYFVYVHGFSTATGAFSLTVNCASPSPNDACSGATEVFCGSSISGNNTTASDEIGLPDCGSTFSGFSKGLWHKITLPVSGSIYLSLCGGPTSWDSYLRLYSGTCGSLVCVSSDDDGCGGVGLSTLTSPIVPAGTYYILVSGFSSTAFGAYVLNASCTLCTDPAVGGTASGSSDGCTGGEVTYSLSGNNGTIQWQLSTSGIAGPYNNISGATNSTLTYVPVVSGIHYFRAMVSTVGCSDEASNVVTTNVVESGAVLTAELSTPSPFCPGDVVTLLGTTTITGACTSLNDFAGSFAPATWTFANSPSTYGLGVDGYVSTGGAPASIMITGGANIDDGSFTSAQQSSYTHLIACSGTVTFNWDYSTNDADGALFDVPRYTTDGTNWIDLPGFSTGGADIQSGTASIAVSANSVFGIQINSIDGFGGEGMVTISNAVFPAANSGALASYTWTGPNGYSAFTQDASLPITANSAGLYSVSGPSPSGCLLSSSINVDVNPQPVPGPLALPSTICANSTINLNSTNSDAGAIYDWTGPNFSSGPNATGEATLVNAQTSDSGPYYLTVTNTFGCSATSAVNVTVRPNPVLQLVSMTPVACTGQSNGGFQVSVVAGTGTPGFRYTYPGQVPALNATGIYTGRPAGTYNITVRDLNGSGCQSVTPFPVTVTTVPNVAPVINCPGNVSLNNTPGQCGAVYTYVVTASDACPNLGAVIQTAGLPSGNTFPVGTTVNSFSVTDGDGATSTCSFSVTVTDNQAPSISQVANVVMCNPITWAAPTITDNCPGVNFSSTHAPGVFPSGTTTVVYTAIDAYGNSSTMSFTVTVLEPSVAADSIGSSRDYNNICLSENITLTRKGGSLGAGATWMWYTGSCGGTPVPGSAGLTSITVAPTSTTTYYVRAVGTCNTTTCAQITVVVSTTPPSASPTYTSLPAYGAPGVNDVIQVAPVPGATFYQWFTNNGHINSVLFNGGISPQETNVPTVNISFVLPEQNYQIRVFAGNACGRTGQSNTHIRGTVGAATSITGPVLVCPSVTPVPYTTSIIPPVSGNQPVAYNWVLTANPVGSATLSSTSGTTVNVTYNVGFISAQLCVNGVSTFGLAGPAYCISISTSAPTPGAVSGNALPCQNTSGNIYSIAAVPGATGYVWTTTVAGAIITPIGVGAGATSATVTYPNNAFTGTVCVKSQSSCGFSPNSCMNVASGAPGVPGPIAGPVNGVCGGTFNYSLSTSNGNTYNWVLPAGVSFNTPNGSNSVNLTFGAGFVNGSTISVQVGYNCGTATSSINVSGVPAVPVVTPGDICANQPGFYFATSTGATSFNWTPVGNVGYADCANPSLCSNYAVAQWGVSGNSLTVTATNACGTSAPLVMSGNCRMAEGGNLETKVYPNPTNGKITVEFTSEMGGNMELTVTDLSGRIVLVDKVTANSGLNHFDMDLGFANSGLYMLYVKNTSGQVSITKVAVE